MLLEGGWYEYSTEIFGLWFEGFIRVFLQEGDVLQWILFAVAP
jgi:hypothetical protein